MTKLVLLLMGMAAATVIFFSPAKIGYNPGNGECGFTYASRDYVDEGEAKEVATRYCPGYTDCRYWITPYIEWTAYGEYYTYEFLCLDR